jgi:methylated-DNA-[protein]-cysteine S-methyltransferase
VTQQRWLDHAQQELLAYFDGRLQQFTTPRSAVLGTAFQRAAWQQLCEIGYGTTTSYGALAAALGRPAAVRAVGGAVGRNPWSIIVPCHRVVGRQGQLTGYAGGLQRKLALLTLEQASTGVAQSG